MQLKNLRANPKEEPKPSPPKKSDKKLIKKSDKMKYDEVKDLSDQYLLPSKVIYQLNSEFNCLKDIAKDILIKEYNELIKIKKLEAKEKKQGKPIIKV